MPHSKVCTTFLWRSCVQMAPSLGLLRPGKRASNLAVFSLSRILTQTVRPRLLSRARQTFDMLPCPIRPTRSKRLRMSIRGSAPLGLEPNSLLKKPTVISPRTCSVFAVVDDAGDLGPQVLAGDDAVDEAVLQQELAGLEALRQLQPHRVPDRPLA